MSTAFDHLLALHEWLDKMPRGELRWLTDRATEYRDGLFSFCPFRPGDAVRLDHLIADDGWSNVRGWLTPGETAVVQGVDWVVPFRLHGQPDAGRQGRFDLIVMWDAESWVDGFTKKRHLVEKDRRATYQMPASWFAKV